MLFYHWRNENVEVEDVDHKYVFASRVKQIEENSAIFFRNVSEVFEEAIDEVLLDARNEDCVDEEIPESHQLNIFDEDEKKIVKNWDLNKTKDKKTPNLVKFIKPLKTNLEEIKESFKKLNDKQRVFVMHIYHVFKNKIPKTKLISNNEIEYSPRIILEAPAGSEKSFVIDCIDKLITFEANKRLGIQKDNLKVLKCAYAGKAAFNIKGMTLHSAFSLPIFLNKKLILILISTVTADDANEPTKIKYPREGLASLIKIIIALCNYRVKKE